MDHQCIRAFSVVAANDCCVTAGSSLSWTCSELLLSPFQTKVSVCPASSAEHRRKCWEKRRGISVRLRNTWESWWSCWWRTEWSLQRGRVNLQRPVRKFLSKIFRRRIRCRRCYSGGWTGGVSEWVEFNAPLVTIQVISKAKWTGGRGCWWRSASLSLTQPSHSVVSNWSQTLHYQSPYITKSVLHIWICINVWMTLLKLSSTMLSLVTQLIVLLF